MNDKYADLMSLSIEQQRAIDLLMTGASDREVAEELGMARETITRWRNYHPEFQAELNRRRRALWDHGLDRLRLLFPEAVDTLRTVVKDPNNRDAVKVALEIVKMADLPESFLAHTGPKKAEEVIRDEAERQVMIERLSSTSDEPDRYELNRAKKRLEEALAGESTEQEEYEEEATA